MGEMGRMGGMGRDRLGGWERGLFDPRAGGQCVGADFDGFLVLSAGSGWVLALGEGLFNAAGGLWGGDGLAAFEWARGGASGEGQSDNRREDRRPKAGCHREWKSDFHFSFSAQRFFVPLVTNTRGAVHFGEEGEMDRAGV